MERIAIDMDEVMSHFSKKCLQLFNKQYKESYTVDHLHGKLLNDLDPRFAESVPNFLTEDDFFINLDVVEGSQKVIQQLTERYEVYIVTAAMEFPSSMGPKYKWLKKHFPFLNEQNFVFCGDKSIIQADYLIDDTPKNLQTFKGKGLLFSAPHNMNVQEYTRLNNWSEVAQYFCHENFKTPSVR
ncbi:MAG TPA: 5'-3'-deoxyribonucleotidase [Sporosarcina sp.]|nr:5'-3'-deoxyribonucleotidase [Sporosarcina sp.]